MKSNRTTSIAIDQYQIRTDGDLVCFNDLYVAAGSPPNQEPAKWDRLVQAKQLIDQLAENLHVQKKHIYKVSKARADRGGGTWGHKVLAVEYSGYLSPELRLKINETFLRAESGDVTLAAEIADKASPQDQAWLGTRMQGKVSRNTLTDVLQNHGVVKSGFGECTNAIYKPILGGTALEVRQKNGWPNKVNIRDRLALKQLFAVGLAECTAAEKIEEKQVVGNKPCAAVCFETSQRVAAAIA